MLIFAVVVTTVLRVEFLTNAHSVIQKICVIFLALVASLFFSYGLIDAVNSCLSSERKVIEYELQEKRVTSGYRQITQYYFELKSDTEAFTISVPSVVYNEKQEGDVVKVYYYEGALKLVYREVK